MSTQHTPMTIKAARALCDHIADDFGADRDDYWNLYAEDFKGHAKIMLDACGAPELLKALEELLELQDEPCRIDHQGYCQSHYLDNVNSHGGCRVANARALVAKVKGGAA